MGATRGIGQADTWNLAQRMRCSEIAGQEGAGYRATELVVLMVEGAVVVVLDDVGVAVGHDEGGAEVVLVVIVLLRVHLLPPGGVWGCECEWGGLYGSTG